MDLRVDSHPLADVAAFTSLFPTAMGSLPTPASLRALLDPRAAVPLTAPYDLRTAVRDCLRHGGFKPAGRSKPSSEYLARAATQGGLQPINAAVDIGNAVSLHSGLPVSVVDLDQVVEPLRISLAPDGARYIFNASGQEIDVAGLLCLHDATGPCANPVKDAQRTKTRESTIRTLTVIWGVAVFGRQTSQALQWCRELTAALGATTHAVLPPH